MCRRRRVCNVRYLRTTRRRERSHGRPSIRHRRRWKNFDDRIFIDFQWTRKKPCCIIRENDSPSAYLSELAELGGSNGGCILAAMFHQLRCSRPPHHRLTNMHVANDHSIAYVSATLHPRHTYTVHAVAHNSIAGRTRTARSVFPKPWERPHHLFNHPRYFRARAYKRPRDCSVVPY